MSLITCGMMIFWERWTNPRITCSSATYFATNLTRSNQGLNPAFRGSKKAPNRQTCGKATLRLLLNYENWSFLLRWSWRQQVITYAFVQCYSLKDHSVHMFMLIVSAETNVCTFPWDGLCVRCWKHSLCAVFLLQSFYCCVSFDFPHVSSVLEIDKAPSVGP
jgi:Na+/melibiose symporter-like transporter